MQRTVRIVLLALLIFPLAACCTSIKGKIVTNDWGAASNHPVQLYTLTNIHGLVAKITSYGATLTELHLPDRHGQFADVVLGFDNLADYVKGHPYFGVIAGRCANRIAKGQFELDGKKYQLAVNNGVNHLHGGIVGFDKLVWSGEPMETSDGPSLKLTLVSPDGDEHYPGKVTVTVIYTLTNDNELKVEMSAVTDAPTIVNLAQHTYWNLGGDPSKNVLDDVLTLHADKYTPTDDTQIPTGELAPVAGTPFDFRKPKEIGRDIDALRAGPGKGYDHNFVVDGPAHQMRPVAEVYDPASGRVMQLSADQPGVQLYTGNFLDGTVTGKHGVVYQQHAGLCLETQTFPDAINHPNFPSPILRPGQTYEHHMTFRFSTR
ncbi:MAG: galactose-1-epimerase [Planctomycetes bacterium]|nr:galactose-1-epimerase [Planctomycetota bacterium]